MLRRKSTLQAALSAETMWDREVNSEDELDLKFKRKPTPDHQYVPEPTFNPAPPAQNDVEQTTIEVALRITANSGKHRAQNQPDMVTNTDAVTLDSSDEEFDRRLLQKFPIGAHLPLSNKPYEIKSLQKSFFKEKTNDFENLRTRKHIGLLTRQEKQNLQRARYYS